MRDDIKTLIQNRRHCVLATIAGDAPYCSLMAYTTNTECNLFFMATHRNTRKFRNITDNPRVSLLIDSREIRTPQALTIEGTGTEIKAEKDRKAATDLLLADHPSLIDFIRHPEAVLICVTAQSAVFLNGLTDAYYETLA